MVLEINSDNFDKSTLVKSTHPLIFNLLSKLNILKTLNEKLNIINKFIDEYSYSINLFINCFSST